MRTASSGSLLLVVLLMVIWLMASNVFAQEDAAKAIVGVWEGTSTSGSTTGQTRLVFSQDGDKLKWKWSWTASFGNGEAEGTVTKIALPCLELNGAYTSHPNKRVGNSPVTMTLTVQDDQIHGSGLTATVNTPFTLKVTKKK